MTGMERNSDIVLMHCYAPLLVNVSQLVGPGRSMQWPSDLIGYDALSSYGSPSYYAQKMFSTLHGDQILATSSQDIPTRQWQPAGARGGNPPPPREIRQLFFDATRDSKSGIIYLKVVNAAEIALRTRIQIDGAGAIASEGESVSLVGSSLNDTNTLEQPQKFVPRTENAANLSTDFQREFPAYSITVLKLRTSAKTATEAARITPQPPGRVSRAFRGRGIILGPDDKQVFDDPPADIATSAAAFSAASWR